MEFHFEKVSLNGILESIYSAQKMNLRKGVELLLDLPDRAAVIYTDPTRLGQVVNNLINNAVKFTAEGRITIGYRLKDFATLEVFVEDTGTGMSEEVLAHILNVSIREMLLCRARDWDWPFAGLSLKGFMENRSGLNSWQGEPLCNCPSAGNAGVVFSFLDI